MTTYTTLKIISLVVMLVIAIAVFAKRKTEKEERNESFPEEKKESNTLDKAYILGRKETYDFEYKTIPQLVNKISQNPGDRKSILLDLHRRLYFLRYEIIETRMREADYIVELGSISSQLWGDIDTECFALFEFPTPCFARLAKYGAIYINISRNVFTYYTLERGESGYFLGSTTLDRHANFGKRTDMSKHGFIEELCKTMKLDMSSFAPEKPDKTTTQGLTSSSTPIIFGEGKVYKVKDDDYGKFVSLNKNAIVCFCDFINFHSKMTMAYLDDLASEYAGIVKVGQYDVYAEGCENVRASFDITAIPTLLFYKDGKIVKKVVGLNRREVLQSYFKYLIQE